MTDGDNKLQLVESYVGHRRNVRCAVETDRETVVTGSDDPEMKEWNTKTGECVKQENVGYVWCMLKTKDGSKIVLGVNSGIQIRWSSDLSIISSFSELHKGAVRSVCELEDGSLVSGSSDMKLKHLKETGNVLQTFKGHTDVVTNVIALNRKVIVSASWDKTIKIWKVSKGECLATWIAHNDWVNALEKLSEETFVSGAEDNTIRVWNKKGVCLQLIHTEVAVNAMLRLSDGSIVTADENRLEIRAYVVFYFPLSSSLISADHFLTSRAKLVDMCCSIISRNRVLFNINELKHTLPSELFRQCFSDDAIATQNTGTNNNNSNNKNRSHLFLSKLFSR